MRMPVLNIFPENHITTGTDSPKTIIEPIISMRGKSVTAAILSIIIIGVIGGMNERTIEMVSKDSEL